VVLVADCVPLVAIEPDARVLAVVHAGWRGVAAGVVPAAIDAMVSLGAAPSRVSVAMGPCISAATYQVGEEVAIALCDAGLADAVVPDGTGLHLADLSGACRSQLVACGVAAASVTMPFAWTDGGATFYSDRAARPCGRFALAARLREAAS
jgi:polyphenol oxidase